jgi:nucleoside 2-deoxyribosyltransferase
MKIYFAGSIRGGRDDQELYSAMIEELQTYGEVLTEHIGSSDLGNQGEQKTDQFIFERDMDWVKEADIIIAEVTTPSLGVGYEIGQAESMGKKIVCVYRKIEGKRLSAMIAGNSKMNIFEYATLEDLKRIFKDNI